MKNISFTRTSKKATHIYYFVHCVISILYLGQRCAMILPKNYSIDDFDVIFFYFILILCSAALYMKEIYPTTDFLSAAFCSWYRESMRFAEVAYWTEKKRYKKIAFVLFNLSVNMRLHVV